MRKDARKIQVSWRMKPEVCAMLDEISEAKKQDGWSKAEIIEDALTNYYWKWRQESDPFK